MAELSVGQRAEVGKNARKLARRSSHRYLDRASRPEPIAILKQQEASRVQELLPLRHARMAASPFAFYRGAAAVMAADLEHTPRTGLTAQLCGDAHLLNFGLFATPERNLTFDINDFDETLPGPWEWDVKRLVTSVELASRELGLSPSKREDCLLACVQTYREAMAHFAELGNLDVWYASIDADQMLEDYKDEIDHRDRKQKKKALAKARQRDNAKAFDKRTQTCVIDGAPHFLHQPPQLVPLHDLSDPTVRDRIVHSIDDVVARYAATLEASRRTLLGQYTYVEVARNVVGVGSVGTRVWLVLFLGRDQADPLLLQVKQATASVLEEFAHENPLSHHGERVVTGQRLLQAHGDILLGWTTGIDERGVPCEYYVRQLSDWKGSFAIEGSSVKSLKLRARICAWTLARGHARTGDRIAIAAYLGRGDVFDHAIARYASTYADQTEHDHAVLVKAIKAGQMTTTENEVD